MEPSTILQRHLTHLTSTARRNNSLMEALCRSHLITPSTTHEDIHRFADRLSHRLTQMIPTRDSNFNMKVDVMSDFLNILIFNIGAFNEEYFISMEKSVLESTEDNQGGVLQSKQNANLLSILRQGLRLWLAQLMSTPLLKLLMKEAFQRASVELLQLFETLDYLLMKYDVQVAETERVKELSLRGSETEWRNPTVEIKQVNTLLFGQTSELISEIIRNSQVSLCDLAQLIVTHYAHQDPPRKIFDQAEQSGRRVIENLMDQLTVGDKVNLFGEQSQSQRPFGLLLQFILQRFGMLYIEFTEEVIANLISSQQFSNEQFQKSSRSCDTFFWHRIPQEYPGFHFICTYIFKSCTAKYGPADSLEIMKKFVFNRFIMSPSLFSMLYSGSEGSLRHYVKAANQLRMLYYEQRAIDLAKNVQDNSFVTISNSLRLRFSNFLNDCVDYGQDRKDKGIYTSDKILKRTYTHLANQLNSYHKLQPKVETGPTIYLPLKEKIISRPTSYIHPQAASRPASKQSVNQHSRPPSSISQQSRISYEGNFEDKKTAKSEKSVRIFGEQISGEGIVETLIKLRRAYGERKRAVTSRSGGRKARRTTYLAKAGQYMEYLAGRRKQIEQGMVLLNFDLEIL